MHSARTCGWNGGPEAARLVSLPEETQFIALTDSDNAAYWVRWTLNAPIDSTYIMLPACAYDGNRFEAVVREYPPMFTEEEMELNPPIRMTQVPRLAPKGDSFMDVTTGDLAAPCVCVFDKKEKTAFLLFFEQKQHGLNLGVSLDQEGDLLHITLRAPAGRRLVYRWRKGIPSLGEMPEADVPLAVKSGQKTVIAHKEYHCACEDIPGLYRVFFARRADLFRGSDNAVLPFSAFFDMVEAQYNQHRFNETYGNYMLDAKEKAANEKNAQWQAGWVGGGMATLPMIIDGTELSCSRSISTLEFAARYQSKIGFYYGIVFNGEVKHDCFGNYEGKYNMLLIRKHADMVYFVCKQIIALEKRGVCVPETIRESAIRAADALVTLWRRYGQLGQFVNCETGQIVVGGSTSGALAPAALAAAYEITADDQYLTAAREIARFYYKTATAVGVTTGGPGEILQAPDSESAAALLESFVVLYETDHSDEWLRMACDAAHQMASWIVPYDYEFPADSRLGKRGVLAAGSVWANVQNKHSAPGLCTLSPVSFLKLYRATGNDRYLRIMREVAHFMPQVVSTPENPLYTTKGILMRPGEMCERVNTSDWEGIHNIGDAIFGSSSWPEASLLLTWAEVPGVYVDLVSCTVCVSDHVKARIQGDLLIIENPTIYPARVKIMIDDDRCTPLGLYWQERFSLAHIPAQGLTSVKVR